MFFGADPPTGSKVMRRIMRKSLFSRKSRFFQISQMVRQQNLYPLSLLDFMDQHSLKKRDKHIKLKKKLHSKINISVQVGNILITTLFIINKYFIILCKFYPKRKSHEWQKK